MTDFVYHEVSSSTRLLTLERAAQIAEHLRGGGLAILPTETGYMLAALATSPGAIAAAFEVKGRRPADTMHVACANLRMAQEVSVIGARASRLLGRFTPGPVTVIVAQKPALPEEGVTLKGTVGIRIPDHPATLQVIGELGHPLTATSLNTSGQESITLRSGGLDSLDWSRQSLVHVVEDEDSVRFDLPSTLVRVTGPETEILRRGPVDEASIHDAVSQLG